MRTVTATTQPPIHPSFRVAQVAGMFDATPRNGTQHFLKCEVPGIEEDWRIGLIVGPSASGKTTIARAAFGDAVYAGAEWPTDRAVIDGFGDIPTKQITRTLTAVGFSSPPAWLRPYHTLSTGERFRCDLARALLVRSNRLQPVSVPARSSRLQPVSIPARSNRLQPVTGPPREPAEADYYKLVVFDEFTSVVDRNVARVCSAAVAKQIRRGVPSEGLPLRFVAVTCHYDIAEWLEPDWILDLGSPCGDLSGRLSRRRLRRPPIELRIYRADREAWPAFAPHHYLSGDLHPTARCHVGCLAISDFRLQVSDWEEGLHDAKSEVCHLQSEILLAFAATLPLVGRKKHRRFHRLVVLPDYQGIGIGSRFLDAVADLHRADGLRINIATSHPAIVAHCRASPHWQTVYVSRAGRKPRRIEGRVHGHSLGRAVASFEYVARPLPFADGRVDDRPDDTPH